MATNRKTGTETTYTSRDTGSFPKAYIRLRTVLDALEINALQYCLEDKRTATRKCRAEEIETWVMPVVQMIQRKMMEDNGEIAAGCQDGYHNCGGVCVPYQCPLSS